MEKHKLKLEDGSEISGTLEVTLNKDVLIVGLGMLGEVRVTALSARVIATRILQLLAPEPSHLI